MYLLIPFLALLACIQGSYRRSVMLIALSSVIVTLAFIEIVLMGSAVTLKLQLTGHLWYWFLSAGLSVEWCLLFDGLTVSMLIAIFYVSLLVQLYSLSYMSSDPHLSRFYGYLSLFTFAMTLLVTADNLIVLFMGWEFVGIASYLLINFWFTRLNANIAALKAFLLNRVGDWALALGLLLILSTFYDFSTAAIFSLSSYIHQDLILTITIFLIIGASAKSSLVFLGLHTWLPTSMEGERFIRQMTTNSGGNGNEDLTAFQREAIVGLLLGDGYLRKCDGMRNSRLQFTFRDLWFCEWLIDTVFYNLRTGSKPTPWPKNNPTKYWFGTLHLPIFTDMRLEYYPNDVKIIPLHLTQHTFTAVSLAYLIMSDGYYVKSKCNNGTVIICTECFTLAEVNHLILIIRKLGMVCRTNKYLNGFRIRFSTRGTNVRFLQKAVTPYFHPKLLYKLGPSLN